MIFGIGRYSVADPYIWATNELKGYQDAQGLSQVSQEMYYSFLITRYALKLTSRDRSRYITAKPQYIVNTKNLTGFGTHDYMSRILKFVSDLSNFVKNLVTGRVTGQSVSKTKVTANVTPRGRSEVFSASTRSKKYSLFVIWHHRECDSSPPVALFLDTFFRIPLCTKAF